MKQIPLTKGKFAIVDDEDYTKLIQIKWYFHSAGYAANKSTKSVVYMHRLLTNAKYGTEVDHINGNRLDNCKENLRVVSKYQNMLHAGLRKDNKTGYKGVQFKNDYERKKPYYAKIKLDKKLYFLGHYETAEEAARAYDKAAKELYGEMAYLNFPDEVEAEI